MSKSEKCYGAAFIILLVVAALGDSANLGLWTAIAVIGALAATVLLYIGRVAEHRESRKRK